MHRVRTHLSKRFLPLEYGLKLSLEEIKDRVVVILIDLGLGAISSGSGSEFLKTLTEQIPDTQNKLKPAFQILADFALLYRGLVQHRIRQHLDILTPDETSYQFNAGLSIISSKQPETEKILSNLKKAQAKAVDRCEKQLQGLLREPSQAGFAIVEEFVDQLLRAEGVKQEFWAFLYRVRSKVWSEEFKHIEENQQFSQSWNRAIEGVKTANQLEILRFLK